MTWLEWLTVITASIVIGTLFAIALIKGGQHSVDQLDYKYGVDPKKDKD